MKRHKTHPTPVCTVTCLCNHQADLQWPDVPPHHVLGSFSYVTDELDQDRVVTAATIKYHDDWRSAFTFRFFRMTLPRLATTVQAACPALPSVLISLVVAYYGDAIRLLGASAMRRNRHQTLDMELHYGFTRLDFVDARCTLAYHALQQISRHDPQIGLSSVWRTVQEDEPFVQWKTDDNPVLVTLLGRVREHMDFTRIVEDMRKHKFII